MVEAANASGAPIGSQTWSKDSTPAGALHAQTSADGWHLLRLNSVNLPAEGIPFELTATYTASEEV